MKYTYLRKNNDAMKLSWCIKNNKMFLKTYEMKTYLSNIFSITWSASSFLKASILNKQYKTIAKNISCPKRNNLSLLIWHIQITALFIPG